MSEFMKELNEMGKGEMRNKKSIVVVGYAPYNPNYESIMRDRVITALEVYQREIHDLILIAGTEIETMSMKQLIEKLGEQRGIYFGPNRIAILDECTNTIEKSVDSVKLLRERGCSEATLITSPDHLWRTKKKFVISNMLQEWGLDTNLVYRFLHNDVIKDEFLEAYNNFAASLKFKGCPSTLSYMPGVPAGNKERLTDLKYVGTLTKRTGVLKSYF